MFGILRTTLALMVMTFHLFISTLPLGTYAVFSFYVISGYLMTFIMHKNYGYTWSGRFAFGLNRFLRLYPQYWAAALFSTILIYSIGKDVVANYHNNLFFPTSIKDLLSNLLILFPLSNIINSGPRLVPPAWALTVEIFFYILICLGISKTVNRVKIWIAISIIYLISSILLGLPWQDRYFPVLAASLPFSIGSAIYFTLQNNRLYTTFLKLKISSAKLFISMLVNCLFWSVLHLLNLGKIIEIGAYINLLITALLVYSIAMGDVILKVSGKTDKFIGDFSYPIYLLHWQSGLLASSVIFGKPFYEFSARGLINWAVSLLLILGLSLIFIVLIDKPIQTIRSNIKTNTHSGSSIC